MGMNDYDLAQAQRLTQTATEIIVAYWIVSAIVAIAVAIYMFRDANARGKSGVAAALIALISWLYGLGFTVIVLCTWILFRPEVIRKAYKSKAVEMLPDMDIAPSSEEYLKSLEQNK
jgi:hypothetical protein